jgi:fatty acid amide hydrolase
METENDRWGPTHNPWRLDRVPGGSSGGEAAAIASGQSPLGLATDIGGSIRIPAAWTGLCGLKPTSGRWSTLGQTASLPGQEAIRSTPGPMARTVGDLILAMQALSGERQRVWDSRVPPLPAPDPS